MTIQKNDTIQARMNVDMPDGVGSLNIYYFRRTDDDPQTVTDSQAVQAIGLRMAALHATIAANLSIDVEWSTLECDQVDWNGTTQKWEIIKNLPEVDVSLAGTSAEVMLPHQNAAVVVADTGLVRCSPKKFIGGMIDTAQVAGKWIAGTLANLANFAAVWNSALPVVDAILTPGTTSYKGAFVDLGNAFVNTVVGSQRRRKIGSGM